MRAYVVLGMILVAACGSANAPVDPLNATYTIEQRTVTVTNGLFEAPAAPGSAAKTTTRVSDARAAGDINGDGKPDAAVVLTSSGGGSGTFFYLAALLGTGTGTGDATNAIQLGDRIVVDSIKIDGGRIALTMLDRRPGEPFTTAPSIRTTRTFQVKDRTLTEIR